MCFVSNNSFVDGISFDGFRRELLKDFTRVFHLNLAGNIRLTGNKGRREGGNVFDSQAGVSIGITVAVRNSRHSERNLLYHRVDDYLSGGEKRQYLHELSNSAPKVLDSVPWSSLIPDTKHSWLVPENDAEFACFLPVGAGKSAVSRAKRNEQYGPETIFKTFSLGVSTNRDAVVTDFNRSRLTDRIEEFIEEYNAEVDRYTRRGKPKDIDEFVRYEKINWSSTLKGHLKRGKYAEFAEEKMRRYIYRPFAKRHLFFDNTLIDRCLVFPFIFPTRETEESNRVICFSAVGNNKPFHALIVDMIPDLHLTGDTQCFPLYSYDRDGNHRKENITDWAQAQVRKRYDDNTIGKHDIFYYVYGLLHHPDYCERYADNLRLELPRIPFAPEFWVFSKAGRQLATLHLGYEQAEPYPLEWEASGAIDYRVEKMHPGKKAPSSRGDWKIFDTVKYNDTLTLTGIPPEAFDYRLGSRSALEWIIDQYRVVTERNSDIVRAPNEYSDDSRYIINLLEKVITVSVETVRIVNELAKLAYR